jgi:hypothetical protein
MQPAQALRQGLLPSGAVRRPKAQSGPRCRIDRHRSSARWSRTRPTEIGRSRNEIRRRLLAAIAVGLDPDRPRAFKIKEFRNAELTDLSENVPVWPLQTKTAFSYRSAYDAIQKPDVWHGEAVAAGSARPT